MAKPRDECTANSGSQEKNTCEDFQEEEAHERTGGIGQVSGLGRKNVGLDQKQRVRKGVREARLVILDRPTGYQGD